MIIIKNTHGFVEQRFDTETQKWTSQEFIAGDVVSYERLDTGDTLTDVEVSQLIKEDDNLYHPMNLIQPSA